MIFSLSPLIAEVSEVLVDVQTELVFFCLAFGTHLLFFSGLGLRRNMAKNKGMDPAKKSLAVLNSSLAPFKAALRGGDLKSAMVLCEDLQSLWQQHDSPSSAPHMWMEQLIKLAAQKEKLPEILELLNKMGLLDKSYDVVLTECADQADAGLLRKAEEFGREHGVKFTTATYQALIKGAGKCGNAKSAQWLMAEAQKADVVDAALYNTFIKGLLKAGYVAEARKTIVAMAAEGLQLSASAFNGLLSTAATTSPQSAWSMFEEMKDFGLEPDQVTCSIILKVVTPNSKANSSLEYVLAIADGFDEELDEVLVNSIVEASVRTSRADLLVPFLKKKHASKRLVIKGAHTYANIIRAHGYVQDIRGVWDMWNEMKRQHVLPISVTVGCMVEALVTNGDIEGGYELVNEVRSGEKTAHLVNAVMYGSIVKGFSHQKRFDRVWEVYREMVEQQLKFSMVTFNTLIDACARSGDLDRIPLLLKDIQAQGLKMGVVTYSAILKGYCQMNRLDEAFELVDDMTKNTELVPDEIMYNTLLDGCSRKGLYDRGMALLEQMEKFGVRPSNFTLSVLIKLANRGGKLEKAFEICLELSEKYGFRWNVHVFNNLIKACIDHHELPRAIGVLERMLQERVRPDGRSYSLLLRAYIETPEIKEAAGLLRAAMGLSGRHPRLEKYDAKSMQPQGGLPGDLVSEILSGIDAVHGNEQLATTLLVEIGQKNPTLKLDLKLRHRLAARMGRY